MANLLKMFQSHNRETRQQMIDEEVAIAMEESMIKTAAALMEVKVTEGKINELLCKYWDLRPSDAGLVLQRAKDTYIEKLK